MTGQAALIESSSNNTANCAAFCASVTPPPFVMKEYGTPASRKLRTACLDPGISSRPGKREQTVAWRKPSGTTVWGHLRSAQSDYPGFLSSNSTDATQATAAIQA